MRRIALIMAVAASMMAAQAQAAELKIATVKIQVIINESAAGKEAVAKLKAMMDEEGRKMQEKQKDLKKLESEYDQQKLIARPEVAEEKEAIAQYGSSDSGATLGDILGTALKNRDK